jgi:hypothetical protein
MKDAYYRDKQIVWFVNDGTGLSIAEYYSQEDAQEKSMENPEWSIGYYYEEVSKDGS